jgi:hypothetical protein
MKQCLITGGGSKFGKKITEELIKADYFVNLVTSNEKAWSDNLDVNVIPVDWKTLGLADLKIIISNLPNLDLIFFNHNASSLNLSKFSPKQVQNLLDWQHSYFVACQFPFYLIHSLGNRISADTKIGWMLSELIKNPTDAHVGFADYIGNKFTNACIMKSFSLSFPACFFAMHPDGGVSNKADGELDNKAQGIVQVIDSKSCQELSGNIFSTQGKQLLFTNLN